MNQPRLLTVIVSLAAFAPNGLYAGTVYPPAPDTTVSVFECGAHPKVVEGSSPFNGSVTLDPSAQTCAIGFGTTEGRSPFSTTVDGTRQDHVAPICTTQIGGPLTMWEVALTAASIRFTWKDLAIGGEPVPLPWISWICLYPWPPS
jgi:hypothetical protein